VTFLNFISLLKLKSIIMNIQALKKGYILSLFFILLFYQLADCFAGYETHQDNMKHIRIKGQALT